VNGKSARHTNSEQAPSPRSSPAPRSGAKRAGADVHIKLPGDTDLTTLGLLRELISQCRGSACVCLHIAADGSERTVRLATGYRVAYTDTFSVGVRGILGDDAVWVAKE
jgi:hypothetical protein